LILFFLGFGSIFATRTYLSAVYFPSQEEIVQQEMMQLDTQLSQINTKLAAYDSIKNDIESFERKMGEVREKLGVIESVQKGRNAIVRMVTLIVEEMPTALWLSQLKIETFLEKINPTLPAATAERWKDGFNECPRPPTAHSSSPGRHVGAVLDVVNKSLNCLMLVIRTPSRV
jgi:Tfp pilus assembly protein PilN